MKPRVTVTSGARTERNREPNGRDRNERENDDEDSFSFFGDSSVQSSMLLEFQVKLQRSGTVHTGRL